MDYWANVDAVVWFVDKVLPELVAKKSTVMFYIVGSKPTSKVKGLEAHKNVTVTGRVEDMRPFLQFANVTVAPLRIARGIQNKVLEAMAMGKAVVASPQAMEGIDANTSGVCVADTPSQFIDAVMDMSALDGFNPTNRLFVETEFSWAESSKKLVGIINQNALLKES